MNLVSKLERKFGKYAIKNLTFILVIAYVAGFIMQRFAPGFFEYLTLDPYRIVHGQVWRLVSWILIPPPEKNMFFAAMMCLFYLSIGTTLERTWGVFRYNLYLFSGMLCTIISSFLMMAYVYVAKPELLLISEEYVFFLSSIAFSTYYVNMSIFLAFATTFPENQVLIFFLVPVKVKWLGIVYAGFLVYDIVSGILDSGMLGFCFPFAIGGSLFNFIVFFFTTRRQLHNNAKKTRGQKNFKNSMKRETTRGRHHKCSVCGITENDDPNMQFRFCSKCDGNYEFCEKHIYTHVHIGKSNVHNMDSK
ncbi:MAG: hypothetical protein PUA49_01160 [Butyrivibrio sp.]|nr:hypothetical protein [Butyrivibrio sp.]